MGWYWTDLSIEFANPNTINRLAISTITNSSVKAITIAILDGVLYIKTNNKMYRDITTTYSNCNILSALLLREFLYSL
ncbi:MAG: hypothetical protein Pg6C_06220 [Treponemataceae bacterium]|nr:MAG: hypothetical protein Pg6C_06220 [Treponemataceae bacterium]